MSQDLSFPSGIRLKVFTVLYALVMTTRCNEEKMGPFNFHILSNEKCSEENGSSNEIDFSELRIKRVDRKTTVGSGNLTFKVPFTNEMRILFDVAKFGNGGWKQHYLTFEFPKACERVKTFFPEIAEELIKKTNITDCPVKEGVYPIYNQIQVAKITQEIKVYPYGEYTAEVNFYDDDKNVGCTKFRYNIEPKRSPRKG